MHRHFSLRWVALCALGLWACTSTSGPTTPSDGGSFTPEPPTAREGDGLGSRAATSGGAETGPSSLETIYFDFDKALLTPESRRVLEQNATYLRQHSDARVEIQGNCDERGSTEYNLALGNRRANAAKQFLVDLRIEPSRLATISFGEENPAVRGHNETAWSKNRRDDFVLR